MEMIRGVTITDAMFISSNLEETDEGAYSASVTYSTGQKVMVIATHRIYESLTAGNVGNYPPSNVEKLVDVPTWKDIGATNKWRAFDQVIGNLATHATVLEYSLKPGTINAISLLNVNGVEARVTMTDPGDGVVYDKTVALISTENVHDWYEYFTEEILKRKTVVEYDLPFYPQATVDVRIDNGESAVSCGEIAMGNKLYIGKTILEPTVTIHDYSVKTIDGSGSYTVKSATEAAFSKMMTCDVRLSSVYMDHIFNTLAGYRATPAVFIGLDNYSSMILYGFYSGFVMVLPGSRYSKCAISVEGLT
jgi:hypothetical protein